MAGATEAEIVAFAANQVKNIKLMSRDEAVVQQLQSHDVPQKTSTPLSSHQRNDRSLVCWNWLVHVAG